MRGYECCFVSTQSTWLKKCHSKRRNITIKQRQLYWRRARSCSQRPGLQTLHGDYGAQAKLADGPWLICRQEKHVARKFLAPCLQNLHVVGLIQS